MTYLRHNSCVVWTDAFAACVEGTSKGILARACATSMAGGYEGNIVGRADRSVVHVFAVAGCTASNARGCYGLQLINALTAYKNVAQDACCSQEVDDHIR